MLQDPLDPPLPAKALRDQKDACLERMKEGARWRDRVLAVDDGEGNDMEETTQLPCEPSLVLGQTLFQLYMQLAVTVCASDACATREDTRRRTTNGHGENCGVWPPRSSRTRTSTR